MERRPQQTDAELLRRAKRDPQAFDQLFERHAGPINRWLCARTPNSDVALELTAEVFAQAWISRRRFRAPADGSAGPWIQGIALNIHRGWSKQQRYEASASRRLGIAPPDAPDREEDSISRIDASRVVADAREHLERLPLEQRAAIDLRVLQELPYDVVAERLQCTPESARMRVMRGLRTLKHALGGEARDVADPRA